MSRVWLSVLAAAVLSAAMPLSNARAFCGFYVSGADGSLYNNATMVVMMREGTRTVLSMQNNYQGPPEDFAMVVPVPVVLQEENVKTLPREIFSRVDKLAAPRLVEYWEQDPCMPRPEYDMMRRQAMPMAAEVTEDEAGAANYGVKIEAQFKIAEYDILILSANDSNGLDTWLRKQNYNIPKGAKKVLRPYVEQGIKFFVAKVDASKVKFEDGKAVLSPLRFHYDTPTFTLPVRLGLLNSAGEQDLLIHVLSRGKRYEVANYPNVTIPTNIRVENTVRNAFGGFYEALFSRTIAKKAGAVVTEYSWDATSCDPCPEPPLQMNELSTLGADVLPEPEPYSRGDGRFGRRPFNAGFVLTRLHYRYGKGGLDEDLVFKEAPPIVGGRGMPNNNGELPERESQQGHVNNFQGRYVILQTWEGAMTCEFPQRGQWGGPPGGGEPRPYAAGNTALEGLDPAIVPKSLGGLVKADVPSIDIVAGEAEEPLPGQKALKPLSQSSNGGCKRCSVGEQEGGWQALFGMVFLGCVMAWRRRIKGEL